jgi:tetratricopeptide (TPR) repeat protein
MPGSTTTPTVRRPGRSRWRAAPTVTALAVLAACAVPGLQIDRGATAPRLDGYGAQTFAPTSDSGDARRLFQQGLAQAYAFNEAEAVRMFKAALARDPHCAICAWGVAWQLGPNINAPERGDLAQARRYVALARRGAEAVSPRERAMIEALALRYGAAAVPAEMAPLVAEVCGRPTRNRPDPLDIAYAERLHTLVQRWPDDADLLSQWAEAEMIATRVDWWDEGGRPAGRIGEVADRLEAALARHPDHTGLNHYLIHAVDSAGPMARRAEGAADRLAGLAPASPHLVHMPSHIHVRLGRYADATRENERALGLDDSLDASLQAQGFSLTKDWRGHNTAFAWFAAIMEGRGDLALALARRRAERAAKSEHVFGEYGRAMPVLTLQRLERWPALLAEPRTAGTRGLAAALDGQARGVALLRLGRVDEARAELPAVEAGAKAIAAAHAADSDDDELLRGLANWALHSLQAEIALAQARPREAIAQQALARVAARPAERSEPPMLGAVADLALGDLQLRAGQAAAAEQTFRADLAAWPDSGWALRGLRRAAAAQGQTRRAAEFDSRIAAHWPAADAALR